MQTQRSDFRLVNDVQSMQLRADGRYDIICQDGSFEVATFEQIKADNVCRQVANP